MQLNKWSPDLTLQILPGTILHIRQDMLHLVKSICRINLLSRKQPELHKTMQWLSKEDQVTRDSQLMEGQALRDKW